MVSISPGFTSASAIHAIPQVEILAENPTSAHLTSDAVLVSLYGPQVSAPGLHVTNYKPDNGRTDAGRGRVRRTDGVSSQVARSLARVERLFLIPAPFALLGKLCKGVSERAR